MNRKTKEQILQGLDDMLFEQIRKAHNTGNREMKRLCFKIRGIVAELRASPPEPREPEHDARKRARPPLPEKVLRTLGADSILKKA